MGLDWQLMNPPRPGKARELRALRKRIESLSGARREKAIARLGALEADPLLHIGAPRIGLDAEATEYLRAQWRAGKHGKRTWKATLAKFRGAGVVSLAKERDAIPYAPAFSGPLDFRGQQLAFAADMIGQPLVDEAWQHHSAREMVDYAERLDAALARHRKRRPIRGQRARAIAAIVDGAVRWLRFWGSAGWRYHAWF